MMIANATTGGDLDTAMEDFAAELAEAAYPIVLRNAPAENWLDLELELWRTLRKTVGKWAQDWPQAGVILVSSVPEESELP
jgi:hypothetical protein